MHVKGLSNKQNAFYKHAAILEGAFLNALLEGVEMCYDWFLCRAEASRTVFIF